MAWTAPMTWVAGSTVTSALLNTHLRDNLLESGPAKVTAGGDTLYATGANALARLAKGTARQFLRMNAGATAPEWANAAHVFVPICFSRSDSSGGMVSLHQGYFTFNTADWPAGYTAYLVVVWAASHTSGTATMRLRNITDGADAWTSTLSVPVSERRDRNTITLTNGKNYQMQAQSATAGQAVYCHEAYIELAY